MMHDANLATEISALGIVSAAYDDDWLLFIVLTEFLNFTKYIFRTFGIMHAQKFCIILQPQLPSSACPCWIMFENGDLCADAATLPTLVDFPDVAAA